MNADNLKLQQVSRLRSAAGRNEMTKQDLVRGILRRKAGDALLLRSATMSDRGTAEVIRQNANHIAEAVAYALTDEYSFLELADAFEWKRTRVRR